MEDYSDPDLIEDVLRRMRDGGDDLSRSRTMDFEHVFPDEVSARAFGNAIGSRDLVTHIEFSECDDDLPWDVRVEIDMIPEPSAIAARILSLGDIARSFGGRSDGWGCLSLD